MYPGALCATLKWYLLKQYLEEVLVVDDCLFWEVYCQTILNLIDLESHALQFSLSVNFINVKNFTFTFPKHLHTNKTAQNHNIAKQQT